MFAEEHRALVRRQLRALLAAGFSPLDMFARDQRAYFYTAECLALVDLSLMVKSGVQYSLWGGRWEVVGDSAACGAAGA